MFDACEGVKNVNVELLPPYLCLLGISFLVSFFLTPIASKIAWRVDAVDYPAARRINRKPIPRMGGIAVFGGIASSFFMQLLGARHLSWPVMLQPSPLLDINYWAVAVSFVVIFATGLIDDKYQLSPKQKLLGQVIAACVAVSGGLVIGKVVNPLTDQFIDFGWISYPITIVYLVAYSNIINLIDGLDGLASGISCISSLTMFILSMMAGRLDAAALAISITGSPS